MGAPWNPPGAELVMTDRIRLHVDRGHATILRAKPADRSGEADLVDEVFELCRARGATQMNWTVRPGVVGEAVMTVLLERGGVVDERTDICFWDLGSGVPAVPVPADVEVWPVRSGRLRPCWGRIGSSAVGRGGCPVVAASRCLPWTSEGSPRRCPDQACDASPCPCTSRHLRTSPTTARICARGQQAVVAVPIRMPAHEPPPRLP
jgi:hypothetical protein